MKKSFFIIFIFSALLFSASSQEIFAASDPTYLWSKRLSGAEGVCVNNCFFPRIVGNNVYLGGYVIGNTDFNGDGDSNDDGELGDTASSSEDIFFVTYDLEGDYVWSMRIGDGTHANESSFGIAASEDGAIYIAGVTDGSTDLNRDGDTLDEGETATVGVHGLNDVIVAAYTDTGSSTWAKRLGSVSHDYAFSVDATNDLVVVGGTTVGSIGDLSGDGDIDDEGESGGLGLEDGFISVFSDDGVYQWSKRFGGSNPDETVEEVHITGDKIYVIGRIDGDADLNGDGDLTDLYESGAGFNYSDIFLSVFSTTGTPLWSVRLGGTDSDLGNSVTANSEYVYLVGRVYGDADLSGDGDLLDAGEAENGYASGDVYITSFTVDGTYAWSTRLGGQGSDEAYAVTIDNDNVLYVAGAMPGPADFDGDATTTTAAELGVDFGSNDIFLVSYSATGTPLFGMRLGGVNSEYAEALAVADGLYGRRQNTPGSPGVE